MRPRTVLVLALVVAVLAAFIWFFERDLPSSEERAELSRKVLPVEADDVEAVVVEWGGETVRLERAGAEGAEPEGEAEAEGGDGEEAPPPLEWRLTEPLRARAERTSVEGLLTALTGLDKVRTLKGADAAEVGLAPPRGRVTVVTAEGERTLEVGADVPASENVLVSFAGEAEVWVTRGSFLTQLEREPGEWRARDVLAVSRADVERIRILPSGAAGAGETAGSAEAVILGRRDDRFYLEEPVEDLAAADAVDQLLSDLVALRARRFLDSPGQEEAERPPPAELGLDPPRAVVVAELAAGGEPLRVELGAPVAGEDGAVYARAGGQVFETETGLGEAAARPPDAWRSRSWTGLRSFEVDRVEAVEPGGAEPVRLVREGVDWRRGEETIPYTAASDLLFALTDAEGDLAPEEPSEPAAPILTVTLASEEGGEETLTLYGATDDGAHPARSSAREAVLLLPADAVDQLRRALAEVRAAEPEEAGDADAPAAS